MTQNLTRLFRIKTFKHGCWQRRTEPGLSPSQSSITSTTFLRYFQSFGRRSFHTCGNFHFIVRKTLLRSCLHQARNNSSVKNKELDLVLYTYDNPRFLRLINIFGFSFSAFWFVTSYQYATMRISPQVEGRVNPDNLPWFAKFDIVNSLSSKIALTILSALLGIWTDWMWFILCYQHLNWLTLCILLFRMWSFCWRMDVLHTVSWQGAPWKKW